MKKNLFLILILLLFIGCGDTSKTSNYTSNSNSNGPQNNSQNTNQGIDNLPTDSYDEDLPEIEEIDPFNKIGSNTSVLAEGNLLYTAISYTPSLNGISLDGRKQYNINTIAKKPFTLSGVLNNNPSANSMLATSFFYSLSSDPLFDEDNFLEKVADVRTFDSHLRSSFQGVFDYSSLEENEGIAFKPNFFTVPLNVKVGDTQKFYAFLSGMCSSTSPYGPLSQTQVTSKVVQVTENSVFYVDNNATTVDKTIFAELGSIFERDFPKFKDIYGSFKGDNEQGKVIFLVVKMAESQKNIMGFFSSLDQSINDNNFRIYNSCPGGNNTPQSNEADILYLNARYFTSSQWATDKDHVIELLFHELQHLVLHKNRANTYKPTAEQIADYSKYSNGAQLEKSHRYNHAMNFPAWINEGLSMLTGYFTNHALSHNKYVRLFFIDNAGRSIINNSNIDYGYNLLFLKYIYERFGSEAIKKIYNTQHTTEDAIFLEATKTTFEELYQDFVKMLLVTGRNITSDKKFNLKAFNSKEGSSEYKIHGFNLRDELEFAISYHLNQGQGSSYIQYNSSNNVIQRDPARYVQSSSLTRTLEPYSFYITKWTSPIASFTLNESSNSSSVNAYYVKTDF